MRLFRVFLTMGMLFGMAGQSRAQDEPFGKLIAKLKSTDETVQLEALSHTVALREHAAESVPILAGLLQSKSPFVRAHAARSLGQMGESAKPAALELEKLLSDPDELVAREAVGAFAAIRLGPKVTLPIFVRVMTGKNDAARLRAIRAVADIGGAASPFLTEALKDKEAAYWACLIVADIGSDAKDTVPALIPVLSDERPEVRREAMLALAAIGRASESAAPILTTALDDSINQVAATFALGMIGHLSQEAEAKIRANSESSDGVLSTLSFWALAKSHPDDKALVQQAVELLAEGMLSEDPLRGKAAARALMELKPNPEFSRPILAKIISRLSPEQLEGFATSLSSLGEIATSRLTDALKDKESRLVAARVLARIGAKAAAAVPALTEALSDERPEVRIEVLIALAAIGPEAKSAVAAIAEELDSPELEVQRSACYALGAIGHASGSISRLAKHLTAEDESLRFMCAWALVKVDSHTPQTAQMALPVLIKSLASPDALVRAQAADALGTLGPLAAKAESALVQAQHDTDVQARSAADEALKLVRGK